MRTRTVFAIGGLAASAVLLIAGIASIVVGYNGRNDVRQTLAEENIVGTPDSSIPGQKVDTGAEAKAFAETMRHHTMTATGGQTYSQLPRYLTADGKTTNDAAQAAKDENGNAVENPLRTLWVTETSLTTALNTAYFAEQVGNFAILMGAALVLTGAGFVVLTLAALWQKEHLFFHRTRNAAAQAAPAKIEPVV